MVQTPRPPLKELKEFGMTSTRIRNAEDSDTLRNCSLSVRLEVYAC
jgi:hypothetical protein